MTQPVSSLRFAVVGHPVAHSRSPFIHECFAQQTQRSLTYERLLSPLDQFEATVRTFFNEGGTGLNVTVPFKEQAFALADQLSTRARLAGAVNTLWMNNGQLMGCNTDGVGLLHDLTRLGYPPEGQRILLIGAGGAARGVMLPLLDAGCAHLHIVNRTVAKAQALYHVLEMHRPDTLHRVQCTGLDSLAGPYDCVINATSASLSQEALPLPAGIYAPGHALAYDMLYGAKDTPFMTQARQQGAHTVADGLGMLVGQAAESYRLWHGVMPDMTEPLLVLRRSLETA